MANNNSPFGFSQARRLDGAAPNYALRNFPMLYTNTSVIARGDVVALSGGNVVAAATTTAPVLGIFDGVEYYDTVQKTKIWTPIWNAPGTALTGSVVAKVIADVQTVFEVQASGANISQIGLNANFVTGTPTIAGQSTQALDSTSTSTTNTLPFRIVGVGAKAGVDNTASYNIVEVILNDSSWNQLTGQS
jgi:hypothetical protein